MKAIILAAGVGRRFGRATRALPKCLVPLSKRGDTLLARTFDAFRRTGIREVVIVTGHARGKIRAECQRQGKGLRIRLLLNPAYRQGSVVSLFTARREFDGGCLIMDADVFFPASALKSLLRSKHRTCFLVDPRVKSSGEEMMLMAQNGRLRRISKKVDPRLKVLGENIGFLKLSSKDAPLLARALEKFMREGRRDAEYEETYNLLMRKVKVGLVPVGSFWTEMDFPEDRERILAYLKRQTLKA